MEDDQIYDGQENDDGQVNDDGKVDDLGMMIRRMMTMWMMAIW